VKTKQGWPLGVCSWSLQRDAAGLAEAMRELGLKHVHLAVVEPRRPEWTVTAAMIGFPQEDYSTLETIRATGGIVPDAEWPSNRKLFLRAADTAAEWGTPFLSMHAGFLEHGNRVFADRIKCLADVAGERKLTLLMETGQESAAELRRFLEELAHPAVGLNFDPANMILYDKDAPADAVRMLAPWIRHVHIKDAMRTKRRGEWGAEVSWGDGEVGGDSFLAALAATGFNGPVAIEREAGNDRLGDIKLAIRRLI